MKRLIVTLCSLALSVAGTVGANQLSLNKSDAVNTNSNNTEVVQYADNTDEQSSLPTDSKAEVVVDTVKDVATDAVVATPATTKTEDKKEEKAAEKAAKKSDKKAAKKAVSQEQAVAAKKEIADSSTDVKGAREVNAVAKQATAAKSAKAPAASKAIQNSSTNAPQSNTAKSVPVNNTTANTGNLNNAQTFIYKNIDLSQCDNTQEVVKVLQQNGCSNINLNNVKQISSLKDILAQINGTNSNSGTTAPAPTTKPVQTTPAPTTKPVQTAPTPTTKPVQTAPTPTTKPVQTTPTPTKAPVNNTNTGISNYANQVLQLVNQERAKAGLSALTTNSTLQAAADKRAQETVQSFSHTRPNGTTFSTVLKEFGVSYRAAGENIAYGQKSPQEVVTAWMNSPGHRANIMNGNFGKIGIGVYQKNGVIYWSQLFTN